MIRLSAADARRRTSSSALLEHFASSTPLLPVNCRGSFCSISERISIIWRRRRGSARALARHRVGQVAEMDRGCARKREHERGEGERRLRVGHLIQSIKCPTPSRATPEFTPPRRDNRGHAVAWPGVVPPGETASIESTREPFVLEGNLRGARGDRIATNMRSLCMSCRLRLRGGVFSRPAQVRCRALFHHDCRLAARISDKLLRRNLHVFAREPGSALVPPGRCGRGGRHQAGSGGGPAGATKHRNSAQRDRADLPSLLRAYHIACSPLRRFSSVPPTPARGRQESGGGRHLRAVIEAPRADRSGAPPMERWETCFVSPSPTFRASSGSSRRPLLRKAKRQVHFTRASGSWNARESQTRVER